MDATDIRNKMGWQAGIVTAVESSGAVAVEPQILYVRQVLRIRPEGGELNLKSNSIDVRCWRRSGCSIRCGSMRARSSR